tara:strand:+ start:14141 stop:15508 length:1368 start_codon:yes stop_codon:yes gene_type:complete
MLELFKIKHGKYMLISFTLQQICAAATSWALVDFIKDVSNPETFHVSKILVLILIAISPYLPGFVGNYFYHMWTTFARSANVKLFADLIDGRKAWVFNTKQRDDVFALQREHIGLIEETTRFLFLNFPAMLSLVFNSIAIGFLLGQDIILGMIAGFVISAFQFFLAPYLTEKKQKQKQETQYETEKSLLGSWQTLTLKNKPFYQTSLQTISGHTNTTESLASGIYRIEALANILVLIASFIPITWILFVKFNSRQLDQVFLMSLGVLLPRILQIFNMSSNLILAGQALQALRIKWRSFEERLSKHYTVERLEDRNTGKLISIIDTKTNLSSPIEDILAANARGRYLVSGPNGSGKSTLCLSLKGDKENIFYLPAKYENPHLDIKGSTGQLKLAELKWLAENRSLYSMVLLDEWDANLDAEATAIGDSTIQSIAENCLVFEVRHKTTATEPISKTR